MVTSKLDKTFALTGKFFGDGRGTGCRRDTRHHGADRRDVNPNQRHGKENGQNMITICEYFDDGKMGVFDDSVLLGCVWLLFS